MKPRIALIQRKVAEVFGVTAQDITGKLRLRKLARPRQAVFYLAREMTDMSYPDIGRLTGGRDHTTVIHGRDVCINMMGRDDSYWRLVSLARYLIAAAPPSDNWLDQPKPEPKPEPEPKPAPCVSSTIKVMNARAAQVPNDTKAKNNFTAGDDDADASHDFHAGIARGSASLAAKLKAEMQ
ncbi:MAG: hypothetical protein HKN38_06115 [Altererythrobacter sp.]|nr:hypothetical protein [Altererythrobacter sp.]